MGHSTASSIARAREGLGLKAENFEPLLTPSLTQQVFASANADASRTAAPKKFPVSTFPKLSGFFTGRKAALRSIRDTLQKYGNASLFGIHGLGKTSVATEYAYKHAADYSVVFFLRATNEGFLSQMAECATDVGYKFKDDAKPEEKAQKFRAWLGRNHGWLVILDNVEDVELVKKYFLQNENGHIIYTSNFAWVNNFGHKVDFEVMAADEAELFLYRRATQESEKQHGDIPAPELPTIQRITSDLGFLPLAINIAGSYIAENQKTFTDYLRLYQNYADEVLALEDESDSYQYQSVFKVFSLAFESISRPKNESRRARLVSESAIHCLKLSSFLAANDIPEEIFKKCVALKGDEYKALTENELAWDAVVREFVSYRLFSKDAANKTFSTHRLLQKVVFTKLGAEESALAGRLAQVLDELFPELEFVPETKKLCDKYIPHLQAFLDYVGKDRATFAEIFKSPGQNVSSLILKIGWYYYHLGQYATASKYFRISYKFNDEFFGSDNKKTLESYHNIAIDYSNQSKYQQAIKLLDSVVRTAEKTYGIENKETLTDCDSLISIYYDCDKNYEANRLYRRLFNRRRKILEMDDPDVLLAYQKLLSSYFYKNRSLNVEDVCKSIALKMERLLGTEHINTVKSYYAMLPIYWAQDKPAKIERVCKIIIEKLEKSVPPKQDMILWTKEWLSFSYYRQGKDEEAEKLLKACIEEWEKMLPKDHPTVLHEKSQLAHTYYSRGTFEEAEKLYQECVLGYTKFLGEAFTDTLLNCEWLALTYMRQNRLKEALKLCQKALSVLEKTRGRYHPLTKRVRAALQVIRDRIQQESKTYNH